MSEVVSFPRVAAIYANLRIQHLTDRRDELTEIALRIFAMECVESDGMKQIGLASLRLGAEALANEFNTELTRTSFNLSLQLEETK